MRPAKRELWEYLGPRLLDFNQVEDGPAHYADFKGVRFTVNPPTDYSDAVLLSTGERDIFFATEKAALESAYRQATNMVLHTVKTNPDNYSATEWALIVEQMAADMSVLLRENAALRELLEIQAENPFGDKL